MELRMVPGSGYHPGCFVLIPCANLYCKLTFADNLGCLAFMRSEDHSDFSLTKVQV